jgi:hypothetical protein
MHVYFLPLRFFVIPILVQIEPAFGGLAAKVVVREEAIKVRQIRAILNLTNQYDNYIGNEMKAYKTT